MTFTTADYWNLLDYNVGLSFDDVYEYAYDEQSRDDIFDALYKCFVADTTQNEKRDALELLRRFDHDDDVNENGLRDRVARCLNALAYKAIRHGY